MRGHMNLKFLVILVWNLQEIINVQVAFIHWCWLRL
jgi:hypothetical protein